MKYFVFIFYIVTYLFYSSSLLIMFNLYFRTKLQYFKYYTICSFSSLAFLTLQNVEYYRTTLLQHYDTYNSIFTILPADLSLAIIYFLTPVYIHIITRTGYPRFFRLFFTAFSIIIILMAFITRFNYFPGFAEIFFKAIPNVNVTYSPVWVKYVILNFNFTCLLFFMQTIYISIILIKGFHQAVIHEKKIFLGIYALLFIIAIPMEIFEYFWNFNPNHTIRPLSMGNMMNFLSNLFIISFMSCYVFIPITKISSRIPGDFVREFHITQQEVNVLFHLLDGQGNKMIAYRLNIAPGTLKNHIYNIYQKTGVQSKIEINNLINRYRSSPDDKIYPIVS